MCSLVSSWACTKHKHCLVVTTLQFLHFLGPGSVIQPKYWLADQNRWVAQLHECIGSRQKSKEEIHLGCSRHLFLSYAFRSHLIRPKNHSSMVHQK